MITVAATKSDPHAFGVQKYDNRADWNRPGGIAPNGVRATRYLRKTAPAISALSPLAAFLVAHCPPVVAGRMPHFHSNERVRVYNGKTEAEMYRLAACTPDKYGRHWVGGTWFRDSARALEVAENFIHVYALEDKLSRIDDWLFDVIQPGQSDSEYWNRQAENMIRAGSTRVKIDTAEFLIADPGARHE